MPVDAPGFWIEADWPAPPGVRAGITTRRGGSSAAPFDSFNLALHVGDDPDAVRQNRRALVERLGLGSEPAWLDQRHGAEVVELRPGAGDVAADGCRTSARGHACAVLVADCIPLLIADRAGGEVAAVHVGWRGLAAGIAPRAVEGFHAAPDRLLAWIGPHIGPARYVVGREVRDACLRAVPGADAAFAPAPDSRWHADLGGLLETRLRRCGVEAIYGDRRYTHETAELFYSYRRDGRTGRMAGLIWIE